MSFLYKSGAGLNWRPGKFQETRFSGVGPVLLEPDAQLYQLCGARERGRDSAALQGSQDTPPNAQMVLPGHILPGCHQALQFPRFPFSLRADVSLMPTCPSRRGMSHAALCGWGVMVPTQQQDPHADWGVCAHALGSEEISWSKLVHSALSCSEVSFEPGSYSKMCSRSEFSLATMGFHSKNDRSNLSQIEWFLQQVT